MHFKFENQSKRLNTEYFVNKGNVVCASGCCSFYQSPLPVALQSVFAADIEGTQELQGRICTNCAFFQ